jgi:arylsulfatase A-like enzyme
MEVGAGEAEAEAVHEQRVRIEWIALALLPLSLGAKVLLFLVGQFQVQWAMTTFDHVSLFGQEVFAWALVFVPLALLAGRWPRRASTVLAIVAVNVVLFLQLIDMRCKQLFFQPLAWGTAVEAAREAGIVRSSLGLFFGPAFTPFLILCMVLVNVPVPALRLWRRFGRPPRPLGPNGPAWVSALGLATIVLLLTVGRPEPYRLDEDIVSGWFFHGLHDGRARRARVALRDHCDQKARHVAPESFGYTAVRAPARGRSVILFIQESLAWWASSFADPARDDTPYLRELASKSAIVTRARSQVAVSTKAIYGILAGRYSSPELELLESMAPSLEGLPRALSRRGYATAFVSSQFLQWQNTGLQYHAMGFDHVVGAEELTARALARGRVVKKISSWGVDDAELADATAELATDDRPFFLVVYNVASHHPYTYPGYLETDSIYDRYRKGVRYGDAAMHAVIERVKPHTHGLDPLIVVVGDHGENIHPASYTVRGCLLTEVEHNVPLVLSVPGLSAPPAIAGARQIDIMPTILDLVGVASEVPLQGRSLVGHEPPAPTYMNTYGRCALIGVVDGDAKQVFDRNTGRGWSYDLASDPQERSARVLDAVEAEQLERRVEGCAAYDEMALRELQRI